MIWRISISENLYKDSIDRLVWSEKDVSSMKNLQGRLSLLGILSYRILKPISWYLSDSQPYLTNNTEISTVANSCMETITLKEKWWLRKRRSNITRSLKGISYKAENWCKPCPLWEGLGFAITSVWNVGVVIEGYNPILQEYWNEIYLSEFTSYLIHNSSSSGIVLA